MKTGRWVGLAHFCRWPKTKNSGTAACCVAEVKACYKHATAPASDAEPAGSAGKVQSLKNIENIENTEKRRRVGTEEELAGEGEGEGEGRGGG